MLFRSRQLRDEAEAAGDYDGPARPHAGRRGRAPRPLSARASARAAAAVATLERIVWTRTASPVPGDDQHGPTAADYRYRLTGRPLQGSYLAANEAGHLVRIDGGDAADVHLFTSRGWTVRQPEPVAA